MPSDGHRDAALLREETGIGPGEEYGDDERMLNEFLRLHPMLSMESMSNRTLQLVGSLFHKATLRSQDLPVVTKSHDDAFLRTPNTAIGERPCINADKCLASFIAKVRYGEDTPMAFTCCEFLLPDDHKRFLAGKGLPARRGKCLLCTRYYQNYIYVLARSDPSFTIHETPLGVQQYSNAVGDAGAGYRPAEATAAIAQEEEALRQTAATIPTHCSIVSAADGYKPSAMLFVDEGFADLRAARESKLCTLMWRPVVRFCSSHYAYVMEGSEPHIVQVGIGADDPSDGLKFFQQPPSPAVGAAGAQGAAQQ